MTYGSVRWAECEEIAKAGLTKNAGVFLDRLPAPRRLCAPRRTRTRDGLRPDTIWQGRGPRGAHAAAVARSAVVHAGATHGRLGEPEGSSWPCPILNDAAAFTTSVAMPVDGGRVA